MIAYTGQMARWRVIKESGIELIDTTVKTGLSVFAPTWDMVLGVKSGKITEAVYTEQYLQLMHFRMIRNEYQWFDELSRQSGCFCCMCTPNTFCHRYLLMPLLQKFCTYNDLPFEYRGELGV